MTAREAILNRLRASIRQEARPSAWRSRRRFDELAARFDESLTQAKGEVIRANDLPQALARLGDLLARLEAQQVVVNEEPPLADLNFEARWPSIQWHVVGRSKGDLREFCARADVGLSGAIAALAETGSIAVESGPGRSRLATLLPPVHIALVPTSRLTADIFTWVSARRGAMPAALTLISGPSKTADIEQTLAVGVHGPTRFIVILFKDDWAKTPTS